MKISNVFVQATIIKFKLGKHLDFSEYIANEAHKRKHKVHVSD